MQEILIVIASTAAIYIVLIAAVKLFGKNELSQLNVTDLFFILLISNAVQNGMVDGKWYSAIIALISAGTLFLINYILRLFIYKSRRLRIMLDGEPVVLIYNGVPNEVNMKKQKITMSELEGAVRVNNIEKISEVKLAMLETTGSISVIPFK